MTHTDINAWAAELVRNVEETATLSEAWMRYVVLDRTAAAVEKYVARFGAPEMGVGRVAECLLSGRAMDPESGAFFHPKLGFTPVAEMGEDYDTVFAPEALPAGELIEAGIGFEMRSEESDFRDDGELRSVRESVGTNPGDLLEPLTLGETAEFAERVFGTRASVLFIAERIATDPERGALNSRHAIAQRVLDEAVEAMADYAEAVESANAELRRANVDKRYNAVAKLMFDLEGNMTSSLERANELWQRAKASSRRQNVGGSWSHENAYAFGEREGITHDQSHQNEAQYRRGDMEHLPGERIDGCLLIGEELELARETNLFHQLYRKNDEGLWENSGWSEYRAYIRRCAHTREERFARLMRYVLTVPVERAEAALAEISNRYRKSIREAAPGPGRAKVDGRWRNVPLTGEAALTWLRKQPGTEQLRRGIRPGLPVGVKRSLRVSVGEAWHRTLLKKEHMDDLKWVVERRKVLADHQARLGAQAIAEAETFRIK